jgi:uncharacterized protein (TIGR02246 family)
LNWSKSLCRGTSFPSDFLHDRGHVFAHQAIGVLGAFLECGENTAALARQVKLLEDREEIRALIIEYARVLDKRDFAAYGKLFAREGEWKGSFGATRMPQGIQAMMEKTFSELDLSIYENSFHIVSNDDIKVNGDSATAFSRWTWVVSGAEDKPTPRRAGHNLDTFVREDGRWKFKARGAVGDIISPADTNESMKKQR